MQRAVVASLLAVIGLMAACTPGSQPTPTVRPSPSGETVTLTGQALAGPVCPVEQDPPDPACEPRPVVGAVILVRDAGGGEVATVRTDAEGRFSIDLAPGSYEVVPQEVEGLMHAADSVAVELREGTDPEPVMLAYDTGIR